MNSGDAAADLALAFADVPGAPCATCAVYDVWARAPLGTFDGSYTAAAVAPHDAAFLLVSATA